MAFDVQAAKADGYTDEEIRAYLDSQGTPTPAEVAATTGEPVPQYQPIDRSEEYTGLAQGAGAEGALTAAKLAGVGLVGGYGLKKVADMVRGPVASPPGVAPGASQRIMSSVMGSPGTVSAPAAAPQSIQMPQAAGTRSPAMQSQMQNLRTAPVQAPPPMAAPQAAPQMAAARSIVQKLALDKVLQGAGGMLKGSVGPGMAMYSGGLNTNEAEELRRRQAMPNPYAR